MKWFRSKKPLYPVYYSNPLRIFSLIVLVFFSWITIEPWNYAMAAESKGRFEKIAPQSKNNSAKSFEGTLKAVQNLINEMDEGLGSGKDITKDLETLAGHGGNLGQLNKAMLAEFAETKAFITEKNLAPVIHKRHADAVGDYKKNFKELKQHLQAISKLGKAKDRDLGKAVLKAKGFLDKNVKKPRHQPLDPNNLPHRTAKPTKKKPRMTKEAFLKDFGMEEAGKVVPVSYDGSGDGPGIPGATFASHPPSDDLPTAADLGETIEVQFTDEINALAEELENNPVKIYNWVRNNIDFVPTYGSIQGANHCLLTKQCNDMDTASLLIALLRTSGIPARYVMGTIELPIDQAMNWVGGFTDPIAALSFIASGGTPVQAVTSGGTVKAVQMEHTWVEGFVDYVPSRGADHKEGDTWVPMDGSFKKFSYMGGPDLDSVGGFDGEELLEELLSTATVDPLTGAISNVNENVVTDAIGDLEASLTTYIEQEVPNATVGEVIGTKTILMVSLPQLSGTFPYRTISQTSSFSELNQTVRHEFFIQIADDLIVTTPGDGLDYRSALPKLAGKRISLAYAPATDADEKALRSFLPQTDDGSIPDPNQFPDTLPAYLINVKPELFIDGSVVATGTPVSLGERQDITFTFSDPTGVRVNEKILLAGEY